jgi:hypothetical protein
LIVEIDKAIVQFENHLEHKLALFELRRLDLSEARLDHRTLERLGFARLDRSTLPLDRHPDFFFCFQPLGGRKGWRGRT